MWQNHIIMWKFHIAMSNVSLNKCYTSVKRFTCACQNSHAHVKNYRALANFTSLCQLVDFTMSKIVTRVFNHNKDCIATNHMKLLNFTPNSGKFHFVMSTSWHCYVKIFTESVNKNRDCIATNHKTMSFFPLGMWLVVRRYVILLTW